MKSSIFSRSTLFIGLVVVIGIAIIGINQLKPVTQPIAERASDTMATSSIATEEVASTTPSPESAPAPITPANQATDPTAVAAVVTGAASIDTPRPTTDSGQREIITLAGGCFWCTEAYLQETPGVVAAVSGYAGGEASTANYKAVSKGTTGHREAVQVTFDPVRIRLPEVLAVYWSHINPTDAGGQFADRGTHYTTAIYYHSDAQKQGAESSKQALEQSGLFSAPIATVIVPYTTFFEAEEYHQDYYKKAADHYERYKKGSGRAGYVEENWAKAAALEFLESQ